MAARRFPFPIPFGWFAVGRLDELPLDQRLAFVLCEVEERSVAEASAILGALPATVRTRVFHARRKLRETLAAEWGR